MCHVFISYIRLDDSTKTHRDFFDLLIKTLEPKGIKFWRSTKIVAGEDWSETIDDALNDSFAVIVILTPEATKSEYITYEWSRAIGMGIEVIPLLLDEKATSTIHPRLNRFHRIDFSDGRPWDDLTNRLQSIKSKYLEKKEKQIEDRESLMRYKEGDIDSVSKERLSEILADVFDRYLETRITADVFINELTQQHVISEEDQYKFLNAIRNNAKITRKKL